MSYLPSPLTLGRRMDKLLVDRSLFAWSHRALGFVSGCTCVLTAISSRRLLFHHGVALWFSRGAGSASALVFFVAALPLVISYQSNIELIDDKFTRTALFAFELVGTSLLADGLAVYILRNNYSALLLGAIYFTETIIFLGMGHFTLGHHTDDDTLGW